MRYFFVLTGTDLNGLFREYDIFSVPFKVRRPTLVNRSGNKVNKEKCLVTIIIIIYCIYILYIFYTA